MNTWMLLLILGAIVGYLQMTYWTALLGVAGWRWLRQRKYRADKRRGRIYFSKV